MTEIDCPRLASQLVQTAHQAGRCILSYYGHASVELKDDRSPVTAADREADAIIVESLKRIAPGVPVVSEESSPAPDIEAETRFFLVDPLDGTREFIHQREEFTVNIAVIEDRAPCFGLVYAPAASKLYVTLARDQAIMARLDAAGPAPDFADMDFTPIATRTPPSAGLIAAISRSHLDAETESFLADNNIVQTHASGSSLKFCCLAEGRADVYPRFGRTMEWDTAAGHAVLSAAGGTVLNVDGTAFIYGKRLENFANPGFIAWGRAP
ncbi:MAG: 3'(2'),5'-bisphosphate nucleotidase CysQ [Methyloligellaceae bacterium]